MTKSKLLGAAGRFGVRYGQSVKRRIATIEYKQRKKQACPFCSGRAVRLSKGIWQCRRCDKKFAGHTYYLQNLFLGNAQIKKTSKPTAESKSETREAKSLKKEKKSSKQSKSNK